MSETPSPDKVSLALEDADRFRTDTACDLEDYSILILAAEVRRQAEALKWFNTVRERYQEFEALEEKVRSQAQEIEKLRQSLKDFGEHHERMMALPCQHCKKEKERAERYRKVIESSRNTVGHFGLCVGGCNPKQAAFLRQERNRAEVKCWEFEEALTGAGE